MEENFQITPPKPVVQEWLFNPWAHKPEITFAVMVLLALVAFWAYKRINPCILYFYLGFFLVVDAIALLFTMSNNPFPQLWQMGLLGVLGMIVLSIANAIFITYLILRLNRLGIEKSMIVTEGFHSSKLFFSLFGSAVFFIILRFCACTTFLFLGKSLLISWWEQLVIYGCLIFLLALLSFYLLPVTEQKTGEFLFGNERADWTLQDIFIPLGQASRGEMVVVPVLVVAFYISLSLLGKIYYSIMDKMAVIVVLLFAYLVVKNEADKDPNLARLLTFGFGKKYYDDDED